MSSFGESPYMLQELPDISEVIHYPLKSSHRIKYTCFDVSKCLIAFGATSGGIYVFNKSPCEFVQLIPSKDGAITRLTISPDEKHISLANGRGMVTVTKCDQTLVGQSSVTSKEHVGNEVTAMLWSGTNMVFTGDDVGKISVLQIQTFIAKTMFHGSSQTIMSLDSRICQFDIKGCMLLVSTLTRSYICDTAHEQYRQIGQKLRDGEYGACFLTKEKLIENGIAEDTTKEFTEVKKFNAVSDESSFSVSANLANTLIYCARPSSRLWEASIDGTVRRTHQFKQVLAKPARNILTAESYCKENIDEIRCHQNNAQEIQSINFPKIFSLNGAIIFSFRKDSLYFLNIDNEEFSIWFDNYKDIVDCKICHDILYLWLSNGSLISLKFMKIDKLLLKCFVDEKYKLCAEFCALYKGYLVANNLSTKLHILTTLKDKVTDDSIDGIEDVLKKFDNLKISDSTQMKSGIFVVDNTYITQTSLLDDEIACTNHIDDIKLSTVTPEAIQALKDISTTMSDKLNSSKKILKEKWEGFEEKMKNLNEKPPPVELLLPKIPRDNENVEYLPQDLDADIVYSNRESSQKVVEMDNTVNNIEDKICKMLYQYSRLSLVNEESEKSNLNKIIDDYSCDIREVYNLMLALEKYCISIGALDESKYVPNNIFLSYIDQSSRKSELLDSVIADEILYKYFVDSCISVNLKTQNILNLGCECGFPLPYIQISQKPLYSEFIDEFIERQWTSENKEKCYDTCKKMPCLWRKILYLRQNEDLLNILRILLQILDESLLHIFLPQFTLETWDRAIKLYATLYANICLNCGKKFDHMSVKEAMSWDDLGCLLIKSVGGRHALKVMENNAHLIDSGALTLKFYHTCLLVYLYQKYDSNITNQITDALYTAYEYENARKEIYKLIKVSSKGEIKNTALPIIVAANCTQWNLNPLLNDAMKEKEEKSVKINNIKNFSLKEIVQNLTTILNGSTDCYLCGLPLKNEVLIKDGGLWVFKCGHTFHGPCLNLNKIKLCPSCLPKV